jgi:GDP-4-dehydro-6-deoxy-D-mannose reductase
MDKVLIIGISGFLGKHLERVLGESFEVCGVVKDKTDERYPAVDITNFDKVQQVIMDTDPDVVIPLAASIKGTKNVMFKTNVIGFRNVLEAVRIFYEQKSKKPRIIFPNSSAIYDAHEASPVTEESNINPTSYYGLTKYLNLISSKEYAERYGLKITGLRFFNLCGPGQSENFVISGFCKQIARIALTEEHHVVRTGGLNFVRDFVDVRDAAAAIKIIIESHQELPAAYDYYNICSGIPTKIRSIISQLREAVPFDFEVKENTVFDSYSDIVELYGSFEKIKNRFNWQPTIPLSQSVTDTYHYWLDRLKKEI